MASLHQLPLPLSNTLSYFAKYNYPLTAEELWYWQHGTHYSLVQIKKVYRMKLSPTRLIKQKISGQKWQLAFKTSEVLGKIPNILAVFVTGSLSMNNVTKNDDIDLMIVTSANTLWITRLFVTLVFWAQRRKPNTQNANNKICFNLWLDTKNLKLKTKSLYIAHEILQAKLVWEKNAIHQTFLRQNSWAKKYLPVAYKYLTLRKRIPLSSIKERAGVRFLNLLAFILQYLYMKSKITTERVGLGYAFFHPNKNG